MKFEKSEKAIFLISGLVISALITIPAYAVDTIILVNEGGGTPESCVAGGGLILAQNLTDLCDVVIITPLNNQLLQYNGTYWVNANVTALDDTLCANVGTGAQVFKDGECNFRTIVGSSDISVIQNLNEIVIDFNGTGSGDTTICANIGTGTAYSCVEGTNIDLRSILAGTGISATNSSNTITITNTAPDNTVCSNVGTGFGVYSSGECVFDSLIAGTGITITDTTDDLTFASFCSNTGTGEAICEVSNNINSLIAGDGITITDTIGDLTLTSTCENTGTGEAVCEANNNINSLIAGTGVSVTDTTGDLTIANTGVTSLTSADTDGLTLSAGTGAITITPKWELLCENTLGADADSYSCSSFTARNHLYVEMIPKSTAGGTVTVGIQFNSDTGNNYSWRRSANGGADSTGTSDVDCFVLTLNTSGGGYIIGRIYNNDTDRKLWTGENVSDLSNGATSAPSKVEQNCKWDNSSDSITTITVKKDGGDAGQFASGSTITVWGWD